MLSILRSIACQDIAVCRVGMRQKETEADPKMLQRFRQISLQSCKIK